MATKMPAMPGEMTAPMPTPKAAPKSKPRKAKKVPQRDGLGAYAKELRQTRFK